MTAEVSMNGNMNVFFLFCFQGGIEVAVGASDRTEIGNMKNMSGKRER